jgi:hypothetical protein
VGIENNECVVATTEDIDAMEKVMDWINTLTEEEQPLFSVSKSLINMKETVFMGPDGSKKGWPHSKQGEDLRNQLIELLESFNYEDGSNPFDWVEVGYGEFGQKVLRGNCKNRYSDKRYHNLSEGAQEGREDCPVLNAHCKFYSYQCDSNGDVAISHCSHPDNINDREGNCTHTLCPL